MANSTEYLNDDDLANDLEAFLPRLYWTAIMLVDSAGGKFIKWTGDGFLAWFETPLHRDLGRIASVVFDAAWHLTFLINVTQLGLSPRRKFRIRHGITYEEDALLMRTTHEDGHDSLDLIGRDVVLAFRLSAMTAPFPGIITHRELVLASKPYNQAAKSFHKRSISESEKARCFAGRKMPAKQIFASSDKTRRPRNLASVIKHVTKAVASAEQDPCNTKAVPLVARFLTNMQSGPPWCKEVIASEACFVRDDLLAPLRKVLAMLKEQKAVESKRGRS